MAGVRRLSLQIRRLLAQPSRVDWLVAGAFTLAAELEVLIRLPQPSLEQELEASAALALLGLAWWRRQPLIPVVLITGSAVASVIAGARIPTVVPQIALFFATYSLGAYAGKIGLAAGAPLPTAMAAAIYFLLPNPPVPLLSGLIWYAIFITGA